MDSFKLVKVQEFTLMAECTGKSSVDLFSDINIIYIYIYIYIYIFEQVPILLDEFSKGAGTILHIV